MYRDTWYRQRKGIPTGGTLCVQLANITVYYILSQTVYNNPLLMKDVISLKRYIDDGCGLYNGSKESFTNWIAEINSLIEPYGLNIDETSISDPGEYVNFLNIKFCFDNLGSLQTDLYIKPTDARSYLYYGSSHPNHVFSGVVYSSCLLLRRIINNDERLNKRLEELKDCFVACNYPKKMVDNIVRKVQSLERSLKKSEKNETKPDQIRVISTFQGDSQLIKVTESYTHELSQTRTFSKTSSNDKPKIFQYVKRTAPSLMNKLVRSKQLAMGGTTRTSRPCNKPNCKLCKMVCTEERRTINGCKFNSTNGTCSTYNVIYLFTCSICNKPYIGRTVCQLNSRVSQHRAAFYKALSLVKENSNDSLHDHPAVVNDKDDLYSLGLHLISDHNKTDKSDFNKFYKVQILENASPKNIDVREHLWIHKLKSLRPLGINRANPFSLPLLMMNDNSVT